jgi:hypothetical protein
MTNPTARAIATAAMGGSAALISFAAPSVAIMAVIGLVLGVYFIWEGA